MNRTNHGSSRRRSISAPAEAPSISSQRPRWMGFAHAAWGVTALLALAVLAASLTGYSVWLRGENPVTPGPDTISGFNVLSGVTSLAGALISLGLGLLLFLRKRHEPMALFVSFYVMTYGVVLSGPLENLTPLFPRATDLATGLIQPLLLAAPTVWLIILLPDGRLVPAWSRWVGLLSVASLAFLPFLDARSVNTANTLPAQLMYATWFATYGLAFGAQIYRYRRVSTPAQREQTRWVVFGLVVWLILMVLQGVPYVYLGNLPPGAPVPNWAAASAMLWWLAISIIPVTLTIAILRYRLYEIDLIINRALVYGALTAILAGLYSASISLFQKAFVALTGEKSDAAIVITTLILASAFTPIRTRLQAVVDRRFRDAHDPLPRLSEFSRRVEGGIWVISPRLAMGRLLEAAVTAFGAVGGEAYWRVDGAEEAVVTLGEWSGEGHLVAPWTAQGITVARITLGLRRDGSPYTPRDATALSSAVESLARALSSTSSASLPSRRAEF